MTLVSSNRPSVTEFATAISYSFSTAANQVGDTIDRDYAMGGHIIRLRFAGPALLPLLTPALNHLSTTRVGVTPDLTISIWDTESSEVSMPYLQIWNDCTARGEVRGFDESQLSVTRLQTASVFSLLDIEHKSAVYWAQSVDDIPWYECGAPFRSILHAWWRRYNGILLHAASVGTASGGVLLVGKGGSGKSTTALACMQSGMSYLGDDYCLVVYESDPVIYSLYRSAKIKREDTKRFVDITPSTVRLQEQGSEKALYYLDEGPLCKIVSSAPLHAILMPRITGYVDTQLVPASAIEAIHSLAPSAIFQLPDAGRVEFEQIGRIVRSVKCYWLEVGTDLAQIPDHVKAVIGQ